LRFTEVHQILKNGVSAHSRTNLVFLSREIFNHFCQKNVEKKIKNSYQTWAKILVFFLLFILKIKSFCSLHLFLFVHIFHFLLFFFVFFIIFPFLFDISSFLMFFIFLFVLIFFYFYKIFEPKIIKSRAWTTFIIKYSFLFHNILYKWKSKCDSRKKEHLNKP